MAGIIFDILTGETREAELTEAELEALPAPVAPPVPQEMSFTQFLIGAVAEGWITEAEGEAWYGANGTGGLLPSQLTACINLMPQADRFSTRLRSVSPDRVGRGDKMVALLATAQSRSAEEVDRFFQTYAD